MNRLLKYFLQLIWQTGYGALVTAVSLLVALSAYVNGHKLVYGIEALPFQCILWFAMV